MSASATQESPTAGLTVVVSLFDTATPKGPAFGMSAQMSWDAFAALFADRREGEQARQRAAALEVAEQRRPARIDAATDPRHARGNMARCHLPNAPA